MKITDSDRLKFIAENKLCVAPPREFSKQFDIWFVYSDDPHGIQGAGNTLEEAIDNAMKEIKHENNG